ncbi:MAG TPA: histidine kinase, partial [Luteimonas sp.]|nr:histidine kinase [Luteimonas sp.]
MGDTRGGRLPAMVGARLLHIRDWLLPGAPALGWMPLAILAYLGFLFVPFLLGPAATAAGGWGEVAIGNPTWLQTRDGRLAATLASVVVFLPLYFMAYRARGVGAVAAMLGVFAIGCALLPLNPFANTYLIYATGFAASLPNALWRRTGWFMAMATVFVAEALWLWPRQGPFIVGITLLIAASVFVANHFQAESAKRAGALALSHDEVRRLAALAERERIGRDLHDLLGHTLSLVALKSDLAARLLGRDPGAAQREIAEVSAVARDALAQVRSAVTGIRAAGMAAELASARLLLACDGVSLDYVYDERSGSGAALPPRVETALALTVREAVTNIQRHARARHARVGLASEAGVVVLRVEDDGV